MNEGFASYYASFLNSLIYPDDRWIEAHLVDVVQPVFEIDADPTVHPMTYYVESPSNIKKLFDDITFKKCENSFSLWRSAIL